MRGGVRDVDPQPIVEVDDPDPDEVDERGPIPGRPVEARLGVAGSRGQGTDGLFGVRPG